MVNLQTRGQQLICSVLLSIILLSIALFFKLQYKSFIMIKSSCIQNSQVRHLQVIRSYLLIFSVSEFLKQVSYLQLWRVQPHTPWECTGLRYVTYLVCRVPLWSVLRLHCGLFCYRHSLHLCSSVQSVWSADQSCSCNRT